MSTLNVTQIKNPDASTPAITLNTDGTADFAVSSLSGGPLAGFRNAIINGNFDVWARGTSQSTSGYGSADRWSTNFVGSSCTVTRAEFALGQTNVPGEPQFHYVATVNSVAGSGNYVLLQQRLEGVRTFAGQEVTLSFWARADGDKNIAVDLSQLFGSGGTPSAAVQGIGASKYAITTTWTKITLTTTIPSIAGKTIGTDDNDSVRLAIWFDAGSDYDSRTDSLGHQSGVFRVSRVQLEPGPVATQFEQRPIGAELALCQRYYHQGSLYGWNYATAAVSVRMGMATYPVTMRTTPSVNFLTATGSNVTGQNAEQLQPNSFGLYSTALGAGMCTWGGTYSVDAEL